MVGGISVTEGSNILFCTNTTRANIPKFCQEKRKMSINYTKLGESAEKCSVSNIPLEKHTSDKNIESMSDIVKKRTSGD